MKAIISINNLVIPVENLAKFDELLASALEIQAYDYNAGDYTYYIKPAGNEAVQCKLLPEDLYEAQKLVFKLKKEGK